MSHRCAAWRYMNKAQSALHQPRAKKVTVQEHKFQDVTLFIFLSSFRYHHSNSINNFFLAGFEAVVFTLAECFKERQGLVRSEKGSTCSWCFATSQHFFQIYSSYSSKLAQVVFNIFHFLCLGGINMLIPPTGKGSVWYCPWIFHFLCLGGINKCLFEEKKRVVEDFVAQHSSESWN